ncbi:MAG: hypothetical protein FWD41_04920 [Actinomycetia bacterium]|nr:hypothetical protein [Actinomycetes bacterium]
MQQLVIHPRVSKKRRNIKDDDVISAWKNAIAISRRSYSFPGYYVAVGAEKKGRLLQMVGVELENGSILVYHAMKLAETMRAELGLQKGARDGV